MRLPFAEVISGTNQSPIPSGVGHGLWLIGLIDVNDGPVRSIVRIMAGGWLFATPPSLLL